MPEPKRYRFAIHFRLEEMGCSSALELIALLIKNGLDINRLNRVMVGSTSVWMYESYFLADIAKIAQKLEMT